MKLYLTLSTLLLTLLTFSPSWGQEQIYNPTATDPARYNTAGGSDALPVYGGWNNTAFGFSALARLTDGANNTAFGMYTLWYNDAGVNNTAVGDQALVSNTSGYNNTATGIGTLGNNITGSSNTALGGWALVSNTTGVRNTASGVSALAYNTTGFANTAHGVEALLLNTTGIRNSALGTQSLLANTTGSRNIAIGWAAGNALTTGNDNIVLGNPGVAGESATLRLGNLQTRTFIAGIKGVPISGATLTINNQGQVGILASSARFKTDIAPMNGQSADIYKLRPVTYSYKADEGHTRQYGLIAEEVNEVYPEIVAKDASGQIESVQYHQLISMLVNEVQKQRKEIQTLQGLVRANLQVALTVQEQQKQIEDLEAKVERMRNN